MEYVHILVMSKKIKNLLEKASFPTSVLNQLFPVRDKSKIKFAYKSLITFMLDESSQESSCA